MKRIENRTDGHRDLQSLTDDDLRLVLGGCDDGMSCCDGSGGCTCTCVDCSCTCGCQTTYNYDPDPIDRPIEA